MHYRSLKVVQNGSIRKLEYGFLFTFHSNYDRILYHFRDKAIYLSKIAIFSILPVHSTSPIGSPCRNIITTFGVEKVEWCIYQMVKKS